MTIESINTVSQFDTISGIEDTNEAFKTRFPSLKATSGQYVMKDISRMNNEAFKFWLRTEDIANTSFKIMVGCDGAGNGMAIQLDFTATNMWIRLVNTSGIDTAYDDVVVEKDIFNIIVPTSSQFVECRLMIANNKLKFNYNNIPVIDTNLFTMTGTSWGFCNLTGSANTYISDTDYVYDQILYGNVNLNGAPDARGIVSIYKQSTYQLVDRVVTDEEGEYMYFIDDDPANGNKYFMFGQIDQLTTVQPRGVMNITL